MVRGDAGFFSWTLIDTLARKVVSSFTVISNPQLKVAIEAIAEDRCTTNEYPEAGEVQVAETMANETK